LQEIGEESVMPADILPKEGFIRIIFDELCGVGGKICPHGHHILIVFQKYLECALVCL
jgi:hypothetical protein